MNVFIVLCVGSVRQSLWVRILPEPILFPSVRCSFITWSNGHQWWAIPAIDEHLIHWEYVIFQVAYNQDTDVLFSTWAIALQTFAYLLLECCALPFSVSSYGSDPGPTAQPWSLSINVTQNWIFTTFFVFDFRQFSHQTFEADVLMKLSVLLSSSADPQCCFVSVVAPSGQARSLCVLEWAI
jgi:hypothetical protein